MRPIAVATAFLLSLNTTAPASPVLDPGFAQLGFAPMPGRNGPERILAACPGDQGRLLMIALNESPREIVVTRLLANGALDTSFGTGGQVGNPINTVGDLGILIDHNASICQGTGTADPSDDRATFAVTVGLMIGNNPDLQTLLARVNLNTGLLDSEFGNNGYAQYNLSTLTPNSLGPEIVLGLNQGAGAELLLTGYFYRDDEIRDQRPLIARIGGNGAVLAASAAGHPDYLIRGLSAARVNGGSIEAVGFGVAPSGSSWILQTLDTNNLQVQAVVASAQPVGITATHRGRNTGSGQMVIAALAGQSPRLLVLNQQGVRVINLPEPPMMDGMVQTLSIDSNPTATGIRADRAVFATGLSFNRGYYAAVVHLGDGVTPDSLDLRFGDNGVGSFRHFPAGWNCQGLPPLQHFVGVVGAHGKHLIYGGHQTACGSNLAYDGLSARLNTDLDYMTADGFE